MAYLRRQPKIPSNGKVTLRLQTEQRDLFVGDANVPQALRHALMRSPVREGKLTVRVSAEELQGLIAVAAAGPRPQGDAGRRRDALLDYLEDNLDRFAEHPSGDPSEEHEGSAQDEGGQESAKE